MLDEATGTTIASVALLTSTDTQVMGAAISNGNVVVTEEWSVVAFAP
jgi:hypothetical protein